MDQDQTTKEGALTGSRWFSPRAKVRLTLQALQKGLSCHSGSAPISTRQAAGEELQASKVASRRRQSGRGRPCGPATSCWPSGGRWHRAVSHTAPARAPQGGKGLGEQRGHPKLAGRGRSPPTSRCSLAWQVSAPSL